MNASIYRLRVSRYNVPVPHTVLHSRNRAELTERIEPLIAAGGICMAWVEQLVGRQWEEVEQGLQLLA